VKVYATADSYRPGYWVIDRYAIIGTGTGTFAQPLTIDGSACTTSGAQGVRDLFIGRGVIGAATSNSVAINNAVNTVFGGLEVFQAAGSVSNILISGAADVTTQKSTNLVGVVNVDGTLTINNAASVSLTGRASTVSISSAATNCSFVGTATTVTNNSTTSRVLTDSREYLPSGQSGTGYTRLPGHKIMAWGTASLNTSASNVTYGVTFSSSPVVTMAPQNSTSVYAFVTTLDSTSFNAAVNSGSGITVMWTAVGSAP
jgi:hypothetical protein